MKKQIHSIIICLLLTITLFTIIYSRPVMESVSFSISIWRDNLFPSLFPFFVLSNCLLQYGFVDIIGKIFKPIMPVLFHLPGKSSFAFIISLFSGFPSGAKYTVELVKKNIISGDDASRLLTFTHYSNPLFILGMIGVFLLNDSLVAVIILISHVVSGIIVGIIFRPREIKFNDDCFQTKEKNLSFGLVLRNSIFDAIETMVLLLGIVTIFLILTTILDQIFSFSPFVRTIISGFLEMTQGVKLASQLSISLIVKAILIVFFISFGGISVHVQVLSIISETKIKYKYFFMARLIHAILASVLVFSLYSIFLKS